MNKPSALRIHRDDNVAVALRDIRNGETVFFDEQQLQARDDIPAGHKIALTAIGAGTPILKYGFPIGRTTSSVEPARWVHTHNLSTALSGKVTYTYQPTPPAVVDDSVDRLPTHFSGYLRPNGDVGIRNEIWILNTVGCINKTAEHLAQIADRQLRGSGIDGVYAFAHPYGCSQLGDDLGYTQRALAGLARNPNAAGVLVLGLGCENNRLDVFRPFLGDVADERVKFLSVQAVEDEFEEGMRLIEDLAAHARRFTRQPVPVSKLRIGMKCGGSDGFSGITANPVVGAVSDALVRKGATTLLTEVPEMFGAETILMNRASEDAVFHDIVWLINDFKDYYERHGQVIYENPSPGNKDGGISTLEEKSLGCIQKGGLSPVAGVLKYGEAVSAPGLHLIQAPGNDMVSVTALAAAGAQMVLFTTGRGTPMGGPVPTVKISTNSDLAARKKNWIDFDAGGLAQGRSMQTLRDELYQRILDTASGIRSTRSEDNGFREIAIFKDGVTL